jgi:hypothetical protein
MKLIESLLLEVDMKYCAFENTARDVRFAITKLQEVADDICPPGNSMERDGLASLIADAGRFVEMGESGVVRAWIADDSEEG